MHILISIDIILFSTILLINGGTMICNRHILIFLLIKYKINILKFLLNFKCVQWAQLRQKCPKIKTELVLHLNLQLTRLFDYEYSVVKLLTLQVRVHVIQKHPYLKKNMFKHVTIKRNINFVENVGSKNRVLSLIEHSVI